MRLNFRIILLLIFCCAPLVFAQAPGEAATAKYPPMPRPTNLKVLSKDIQVGDLIGIMLGYEKQLGVECEFCHTKGAPRRLNFADDSKPEKITARTMIAMTNEINAKYLAKLKAPEQKPDQKVNCGTCHRGHSQPIAFTPAEQQPSEPGQTPPAQ